MKNTPTYIIVHTSDVLESRLYNQFSSINNYHRDIRFFTVSSLGYHTGYHYLITGGKKYQCRLDTDEGSHCNDKVNGTSMNFQSIGICWGGDGDLELPSTQNRILLAECIKEKMKQYNIPRDRVKFHRDFTPSKTCPGTLFTQSYLDVILSEKSPEPEKVIKINNITARSSVSWDVILRFIAIMALLNKSSIIKTDKVAFIK